MRAFLSTLLIAAYLFALIMSTGHLSEWYKLTLGELPGWFAVGLAAALEASAFLLSLLSNSILKTSQWANYGALVALGLVWVGNYFSMARAAPAEMSKVEVFLSSLFVPVSTYVVAKVLGELLALSSTPLLKKEEALEEDWEYRGNEASKEIPVKGYFEEKMEGVVQENRQIVPPLREIRPFTFPKETSQSASANGTFQEKSSDGNFPKKKGRNTKEAYLEVLKSPKTAKEISDELQVGLSAVYKQLRVLEEEGLIKNEGGRWKLI